VEENNMKWLTWNDLTDIEKEQAIESYCGIREWEEQEPCSRERAIEDLPCCKFERQEDGYIYIEV
jgi:hypothetical protein